MGVGVGKKIRNRIGDIMTPQGGQKARVHNDILLYLSHNFLIIVYNANDGVWKKLY